MSHSSLCDHQTIHLPPPFRKIKRTKKSNKSLCRNNQRFLTKRRTQERKCLRLLKTRRVMEEFGDFSLSCKSSRLNDILHRIHEEDEELENIQKLFEEQQNELFWEMYEAQENARQRRQRDYDYDYESFPLIQ